MKIRAARARSPVLVQSRLRESSRLSRHAKNSSKEHAGHSEGRMDRPILAQAKQVKEL